MDKNLLEFVYLTGLRVGAVLHLRWEDISPGHVFVTTKRGQKYNIPVAAQAEEILKRQDHIEGTQWVWPRRGRGGHGFQDLPWTTEGVNHRFRDVFSGIDGQFHRLRHNFAVRALSTGNIPLDVIQDLYGHSTVAITRIYARRIEEDVRRGLDAQGEELFAKMHSKS